MPFKLINLQLCTVFFRFSLTVSHHLCHILKYSCKKLPWAEAGVWLCVLSLLFFWPRWNRGTRWTALRSSLTPHPTNWSSWTNCSPEQWCPARCEPPCTPSLIHSAASLHCFPTASLDLQHVTDHLVLWWFWQLMMHNQWFALYLTSLNIFCGANMNLDGIKMLVQVFWNIISSMCLSSYLSEQFADSLFTSQLPASALNSLLQCHLSH